VTVSEMESAGSGDYPQGSKARKSVDMYNTFSWNVLDYILILVKPGLSRLKKF